MAANKPEHRRLFSPPVFVVLSSVYYRVALKSERHRLVEVSMAVSQ